jgi:hypothetical protein
LLAQILFVLLIFQLSDIGDVVDFEKFDGSLALLEEGHLKLLHQEQRGQRQPLVLALVKLAHLLSLHLLMVSQS